MPKYAKGDKVLYTPTREVGYIVDFEQFGRGDDNVVYKVVINGSIQECYKFDLEEVCDITDPFVLCEKGMYGNRIQYIKTNTTWKIRNSNNSSISSLKASTTLFKPHQFKPLLKFLESENRRILVADEVGLGKTIEAGHIMMEMKARGELKNVLIVCPNSLIPKWTIEMSEKFGLEFSKPKDTASLIDNLKQCNGLSRCVINYDKFNRYQDDEDDSVGKDATKDLLAFLEQNPNIRYSLIICDEAHKVRNESANTSAAIKRLLSFCEAAVFLTATPLQTKYENLFNLLNLLDEDTYDNFQIFKNHINENKPFIKALEKLGNPGIPMQDIARELEESDIVTEFFDSKGNQIGYTTVSTVKETFDNYPLYKRAIETMKNGDCNADTRASARHDLSKMSIMNNIVSRTRKREVTTDMSQAERNAIKISVVLAKEERRLYDSTIQRFVEINGHINERDETVIDRGQMFAYVSLRQQLSSSVFGYLNEKDNLLKGIDKYEKFDDGKVAELLKIINEVFVHGKRKIIVFAEYVNTILYLSIRLKKLGYNAITLWGNATDESGQKVDKMKEIERFRLDPDIPLLIANKVISEGLDLQFCDTLVNYDLPWNPMDVEQRIGRIDRFGQESQYIHIYNFIVSSSIQENIFLRLLDRIGLFRSSIGEIETILDAKLEKDGKQLTLEELYSSFIDDAYCQNWSDEVIKKKEQEIEMAFANERRNIEDYEEGFATALTNDSYFNQEINKILNNNAYVTEFELRNYIEMLLRECLTQCTLEHVGNGIYMLVQPKANIKLLSDFLEKYKGSSIEDNRQVSDFKTKVLTDKQSLKITFNQELAFKDKSIAYINLYNPLIKAATLYFDKSLKETDRAFNYAIIADNHVHRGDTFFLAIYQISTKRNLFGVMTHNETMYPILFNVNTQDLEKEEIAYHVWSSSQTETVLHAFCPQPDIPLETVKNMHKVVLDRITNERNRLKQELDYEHENRRVMKIHDYEKWIESKRNKSKERISEAYMKLAYAEVLLDNKKIRSAKGAVTKALNANKRLEESYNLKIQKLNEDPEITVNPLILTISLITVI